MRTLLVIQAEVVTGDWTRPHWEHLTEIGSLGPIQNLSRDHRPVLLLGLLYVLTCSHSTSIDPPFSLRV